jgi:hypothetical protein
MGKSIPFMRVPRYAHLHISTGARGIAAHCFVHVGKLTAAEYDVYVTNGSVILKCVLTYGGKGRKPSHRDVRLYQLESVVAVQAARKFLALAKRYMLWQRAKSPAFRGL